MYTSMQSPREDAQTGRPVDHMPPTTPSAGGSGVGTVRVPRVRCTQDFASRWEIGDTVPSAKSLRSVLGRRSTKGDACMAALGFDGLQKITGRPKKECRMGIAGGGDGALAYMKTVNQIFQSVKAALRYIYLKPSDVFTVPAVVPASCSKRSLTNAFSSGVRNNAVSGESGSVQGNVMPTTEVKIPSTTRIHRQPFKPPRPSIFSGAKAKSPEKAPASDAAEKKIERRH
ncbi:hypothetical protein CSAL01_07684 [Colletotrichum salicis]|uniref:Uncharacterized protein n=1 Tax=Colletotrichum salicis TaxID=1209931 RepID=A0A135U024_9PEZI|nr:hypothetical protein CSAL01_07684 [Colletotrichum salicis]